MDFYFVCFTSLFVAIAIEAFNKLGTVDEDQVRPMERQPSDPRPSSTDVCSIPIFSPSLVSYEPFSSFSSLAENDPGLLNATSSCRTTSI